MQRSDISSIRINKVKNPRNKIIAMANVVFSNGLTLNSLKVINGSKGLFVGMPSKPITNGDKKYDDLCYFTDREDRDVFNQVLLEEYEKQFGTSEQTSEGGGNEYNFGGPDNDGPF